MDAVTLRRVWTCDRCGTTGPAPQFSRVALATVDGRFGLHKAADLCHACRSAVYAAWDEWVRLPAATVVSVEP